MNHSQTNSRYGLYQPATGHGEEDLDRAVRHAAFLRRGFYLVVLAVA